MTSPIDIDRTVNVLIQRYGTDDAPLTAAKRCDALLEIGDLDGLAVWKGVLRALQEITRTERDSDEMANQRADATAINGLRFRQVRKHPVSNAGTKLAEAAAGTDAL